MAKSLEDHRGNISKSLAGRRLGLTYDDFLVGAKQLKNVVTSATAASTGTNLPNHGIITIESSAAKTHKLTAPTPGCHIVLASITTSTLVRTISLVSGTITSTQGVAGASFTFNGLGDRCELHGLSTAKYLMSNNRSVAVS